MTVLVASRQIAGCPDRGFVGPLDLRLNALDTEWSVLTDLMWVGAHQVFTITAGSTTDLASVPASMTWLVARYGGGVTRAAVLHDFLCRSRVVSRRDADAIFRLALLEAGVSELRAELLWAAVRLGSHMDGATPDEYRRVARLLPLAALLLLPTPMVWAWQLAFRTLESRS